MITQIEIMQFFNYPLFCTNDDNTHYWKIPSYLTKEQAMLFLSKYIPNLSIGEKIHCKVIHRDIIIYNPIS